MQKQEQKVKVMLGEMKLQVKLIDHMGSDLTVVNAARVSFAKESEWESIPEGGDLLNTKSVWCGMKYLDDMWMTNQSSIHLKSGD